MTEYLTLSWDLHYKKKEVEAKTVYESKSVQTNVNKAVYISVCNVIFMTTLSDLNMCCQYTGKIQVNESANLGCCD